MTEVFCRFSNKDRRSIDYRVTGPKNASGTVHAVRWTETEMRFLTQTEETREFAFPTTVPTAVQDDVLMIGEQAIADGPDWRRCA